jgi:hypothetical protein
MLISNFRWRNFEPELLIQDQGKEKTFPLMNQNVNMKLGKRFCTGYSKNGKRFPCPESRLVSSDRQCQMCKSLDHYLPCIQCSGLCTNLSARRNCMEENYIIYLAAFGPLMKVGISREQRIKQRLVEQGADFGATLTKIKDGRIARVYEQRIRRYLGITDRLRGTEKHPHMFSDPRICIKNINSSLAKLSDSSFSSMLNAPEIFDLRENYNLLDVESEMMKLEENSMIDGRIACVKGSIMLVENGSFKCVDCHALIGREIISQIA